MRNLFIDLGHSAKFPGAAGFKTEIAWNRAIWAKLQPLLDKKKWNVIVVPDEYAGVRDANSNLIKRIAYINKLGSVRDFLLSIHGNAAANKNVRGVTTCFMGGSESAKREAAKLSLAYAKGTSVPVWSGGAFDDRNGRYGRIGMVRDTEPFALLIEAGFVTNQKDMAVDPAKAAQAIAGYFNAFPL